MEQANINSSCKIEELVKKLSYYANLSRLPTLEPKIFTGDLFTYKAWRHSIDFLIDCKPISGAQKLVLLSNYIDEKIKKEIVGYLMLPSDSAYKHTLEFLDERYGNPMLLAHAFRERLDSWPCIKDKDGKSLRQLSDFLIHCQRVKENNKYLSILDNPFENQKMLRKLPGRLIYEWVRVVHESRLNPNDYPPFAAFVTFLKKEADILCDPILDGLNIEKDEIEKKCLLCYECHDLGNCDQFQDLSCTERKQLCVKNGLCFRCLQSQHISKLCRSGIRCDKCHKGHSTYLHGAFVRLKNDIKLLSPSKYSQSLHASKSCDTSTDRVILSTDKENVCYCKAKVSSSVAVACQTEETDNTNSQQSDLGKTDKTLQDFNFDGSFRSNGSVNQHILPSVAQQVLPYELSYIDCEINNDKNVEKVMISKDPIVKNDTRSINEKSKHVPTALTQDTKQEFKQNFVHQAEKRQSVFYWSKWVILLILFILCPSLILEGNESNDMNILLNDFDSKSKLASSHILKEKENIVYERLEYTCQAMGYLHTDKVSKERIQSKQSDLMEYSISVTLLILMISLYSVILQGDFIRRLWKNNLWIQDYPTIKKLLASL